MIDRLWLAELFFTIMKVSVRTSQATSFFCYTQTLYSTLANSQDTKPLERDSPTHLLTFTEKTEVTP